MGETYYHGTGGTNCHGTISMEQELEQADILWELNFWDKLVRTKNTVSCNWGGGAYRRDKKLQNSMEQETNQEQLTTRQP